MTEPDLRLDPGVRLTASRRGPWRPIGPRVRRVGSDGSDHDPVLDWFGELSGGGRRTPVTERPAGGRRDDGYVDVEAQQEHLTGLHRAEIDLARPPVVPPRARGAPQPAAAAEPGETTGESAPDQVGARGLLRGLRTRRRGGGAPDAGLRARATGTAAHRGLQVHADRWWRQLHDNDPRTVRHRLELAFALSGFGAAVAGVQVGVASLVLGVAPVDVMVGRWQRPSEGERLARLTVPERHRLHATMIRSGLVALAAEAVAVAPGLTEVRCAVVQADHPEGRPAVLALAVLTRDDVLSEDVRERLVDGAAAPGRSRIRLAPIGSGGALAPLDRDLPAVARVLDALTG
jgi:hypothetical protein